MSGSSSTTRMRDIWCGWAEYNVPRATYNVRRAHVLSAYVRRALRAACVTCDVRTHAHVRTSYVARWTHVAPGTWHPARGHPARGHPARGHPARGHPARPHIARGHSARCTSHVARGHPARAHVSTWALR